MHCADNIHFYERHFELAEKIVHEPLHEKQYIMNILEPLFNIKNGEMELTKTGADMIHLINEGVSKNSENSYYYNILCDYLNIKKV
jgi:hypothetical protein